MEHECVLPIFLLKIFKYYGMKNLFRWTLAVGKLGLCLMRWILYPNLNRLE